jgi:hypothetical protein
MLIVAILVASFLPVLLHAQPTTPSAAAEDTVRRDAAGLVQFERKARLSKELGATHLVVTEGLPLATWEMDPADPYPMWFVHHASLLKKFRPRTFSPMSI